MEILDLKLAGLTLWTWCAVIGVSWFLYQMYSNFRRMRHEDRERKKRENPGPRELELRRMREREIEEMRRGMAEAVQNELRKQGQQPHT